MPRRVSRQPVLNPMEQGERPGLLSVPYLQSGGGEEWFWHCPIEGIVDWADISEVWLPSKTELSKVHPAAVLPAAMGGLWPVDDSSVKLSTMCAWFDGTKSF